MANFCNKCGAPVSGIFCVKCGYDTRLAGTPPPHSLPRHEAPASSSQLLPRPPPARFRAPVRPAPAAKFCNKCGAPSIGAPFCNKCGANLREAAARLATCGHSGARSAASSRDTTSITSHACATSANQGQSPDQDSRWLCRGGDYRRCSRSRRRVLRRLSRKAEGARGRVAMPAWAPARKTTPAPAAGSWAPSRRWFPDQATTTAETPAAAGTTAASAEIPAAFSARKK